MDFHEKQSAYQELKGAHYLEADRALLARLRPASRNLKGPKNPDLSLVQERILWELLDAATPEEIRRNREQESGMKLFAPDAFATGSPPAPDKKKNPEEALPSIPVPQPSTLQHPLQKETEYPHIRWENLEDVNVQKATILYNDRINTHRELVRLDKTIDQDPSKESVKRMAELRIRNLLCFKELQTYNDTGKFLHEHPLIVQFSLRSELEDLLARNPDQYLEEYRNVANNVTRYRSYLKGDRSDKKKTESWKERLKEHQEREALMKDILTHQHHE